MYSAKCNRSRCQQKIEREFNGIAVALDWFGRDLDDPQHTLHDCKWWWFFEISISTISVKCPLALWTKIFPVRLRCWNISKWVFNQGWSSRPQFWIWWQRGWQTVTYNDNLISVYHLLNISPDWLATSIHGIPSNVMMIIMIHDRHRRPRKKTKQCGFRLELGGDHLNWRWTS